METFLLRDIEDRTLAMAEGEFVHFRIARPVLGTYYERNISFAELTAIVGRLSNLGLLMWRIRHGRTWRFRSHAPVALQHSCAALFTCSTAGVAHLRKSRHVA
jgi:hypothetical protein